MKLKNTNKITTICVEGMDKTGKGLIASYIKTLTNHKYIVFDRGLMSNLAYDKLFKRDQTFNIKPFQSFFYVYLTCDFDDWKIRCKLTNEPEIPFKIHHDIFEGLYNDFLDNNFKIIKINTSNCSPYKAAQLAIDEVEKLNSLK